MSINAVITAQLTGIKEMARDIHNAATMSGKDFKTTFDRAAKLDPKTPTAAEFATRGRRLGDAFKGGFDSSTKDLGRELGNISNGLGKLTSAAGSFAKAGLPAVLLGAASAATTLVGAVGVLPGVLAGAAAGVGTLVVGLHGFGDAIKDMGDPKKFAEDLQKLAPAAQQTALEIKNLVDGPLGELKKATQEALFSGMAKEIHDLTNTLLPSVKTAMTGIATGFNTMGKGVMGQLMTPQTSQAIASTLQNVTTAFQNLAPAAAPFTAAIANLVQVGSTFLPGFATTITNAANAFAQFIAHARDSGQLSNWIRDGVDMIKQLGSIAWDVGRAFLALAEVGKDVLPTIAGLVKNIADLLQQHPGLIQGVVIAFAAWKSIEGIAAVITGLGTIKAGLLGLPAVAGTAAAGISAALSKIALPAWLAWMIGKEHDKDPTQAKANDAVRNNDINGFLADFQGGGGTFLPPGPGPDIRTPQQIQDQIAQRRMGLPGGAPLPAPAPGWNEFLPTAGLAPWQPSAVPGVPATGGSKASQSHGPTVPYSGDPMSLIQGYQPTAALYNAAGNVLQGRQKVEQARADLAKLESANVRDEDAITAKRNELAKAQQEQVEAELRLNEAKASATKKLQSGMADASKAFGDIGAHLDQDLGFSKGLPGLADNLVRFLASLATAPLQGQLSQIASQGDGSYGLFGMAFGGSNKSTAQQQVYFPGQGMAGYPGDAALLSNVGPGRYSQDAGRDLLKGLSDCSSSIGDLVNILDTGTTGGQKLTTGNAADWLPAHGFVRGMGGPGDFRVGYNGGHMQATLPGGTPWNWGSDAAAARGGVGGTGAFDPAFTDHFYRPGGGSAPSAPTGLSWPGQPPSAGPGPLPSLAGGPLSSGMPNGLPMGPALGPVSPGYSAQSVPQAQGGWQPNGGGGVGIGGGLMGAAMSAGSMAADMFAPGAGAAAQMAMKAINRTIQFGGQAAGIGVEGLIDTLTPTNPDTGQNPLKDSWIWRVAGALAGARPAGGSGGAGDQDKAAQKRQEQAQAAQQGDTNHTYNAPQNMTQNINVMQGANQSGKSLGQDAAQQLQQAVMLPR